MYSGPNDHSPVRHLTSERRRWFWLVLLAPIACILAWIEPDEQALYDLCASRGKPVIYQSVQADGYYDGTSDNCWGCWNNLENADYTFIEFSLSRQRQAFDPITSPGIYRVSRIDAGSKNCHEPLTAYYKKTSLRREQMERHNWCFQVERFNSRQARFAYYHQSLGVVRSNPVTGSSISARRMFYVDHQAGRVIAEATNYSLGKYPYFQPSSFGSTKHCNTYIDDLGPRGLNRQAVIVPSRERDL